MAETPPPPSTCELCNNHPTIYCPSDTAFLCSSCDAAVHSANFLVARHLRISLCHLCLHPAGIPFAGAGNPSPSKTPCKSCSPEDDVSDSRSSSSCCVSSTTDAGDDVSSRRERVRRREKVRDMKVEGVLVNWCRRMGVKEGEIGRVISTVVKAYLGGMTVLPFRVCLAASFWLALGDTCRDLRKVELVSGVPGKLILATEARLARVIRRRRSSADHEEGWAEC